MGYGEGGGESWEGGGVQGRGHQRMNSVSQLQQGFLTAISSASMCQFKGTVHRLTPISCRGVRPPPGCLVSEWWLPTAHLPGCLFTKSSVPPPATCYFVCR